MASEEAEVEGRRATASFMTEQQRQCPSARCWRERVCVSASGSAEFGLEGGAAVEQIVECIRHAAELAVGRGRGWARVQSVHGSSAAQVVRVHQACSSGSSRSGEQAVVDGDQW
jgi:hypothetical protein